MFNFNLILPILILTITLSSISAREINLVQDTVTVTNNETNSTSQEEIGMTTEMTELEESVEVDQDDADEDAVAMRAISLVWGTYGIEWVEKVSELETNILDYYATEMTTKTQACNWTEKDKNNWTIKLKHVKDSIKNLTDTASPSKDVFGLEDFRERRATLKSVANWTLDIMEDMEGFTKALVLGSESDSVVLTYGGYLREVMMTRQLKQNLKDCYWTGEDRKRAGKRIGKILGQMVGKVLKGLADQFEVKVRDLITAKERKTIKDSVQSHKKSFENLFQPFYKED